MRTPDIEEVGKTTRHGTFFQMLGNFSFGDYFKDQAIPFAWELLTTPERDGGFGFPEDRLWATVYHDDDEAARIWRDVVGVPESRIQRRGMADNYWSMGVPGPCGPCSEIYYDRGPDYGREGGPVADEERYLEVWNLVFMQYLRGEGAGKEGWPILGELPSRNIDTGMGLERMAAILQGVDNIYEVDTLWKVLDRAAELTEQKYGRDHRVGRGPAGGRRPRAHRGHAGGRRGAALQRGARLRAAPDPAPQHLQPPAAGGRAARRRQRGPLPARAGRNRDRTRMAEQLPGAGRGGAADTRRDRRRGVHVPVHAAHRLGDLRRRGGREQAAGRRRTVG